MALMVRAVQCALQTFERVFVSLEWGRMAESLFLFSIGVSFWKRTADHSHLKMEITIP